MARRIVCRCRSRPSSPIHAMSAAYSRSSLRSKQPPPSARHVGPHGPEPSAPHGSGPQERICSSSCLSWLHLLKSWSLRQSRGGSVAQGIIGLSYNTALSMPEFKEAITGRLNALHKAIKLINREDWKGVGLNELLKVELASVMDRIDVCGGDALLKSKAAQSLSLLFYELMTNSTKHGAL